MDDAERRATERKLERDLEPLQGTENLSFAIFASGRSRLTWNDLGTNNRSTCQPFFCLSFDSSDSC
jgi:hypothetical protein